MLKSALKFVNSSNVNFSQFLTLLTFHIIRNLNLYMMLIYN